MLNGRGLVADPPAGDAHTSPVGIVHSGQTCEQGGFSRTGRAGDNDEFAVPGSDGNPLQRQGFLVAGPVESIQRRCLHGGFGGHHDHCSESVTARHGSTLSAPRAPVSVRTTSWPSRQNS